MLMTDLIQTSNGQDNNTLTLFYFRMLLSRRFTKSANSVLSSVRTLSYQQCKEVWLIIYDSENTNNNKIQIREENLFPCMTAHFKEPLLIEKGEMQYLFDHNGKKYLDLFGGIVTVSVGHCHPRVNQALIDQAQKLWHTTQIYWYEGIHKYAKQLADTLPEGLDQGKTYII